jgi:two-component system sensor histidine kinase BaeS
MHSLFFRVAGVIFTSIAVVVLVIVAIVNYQVTESFTGYLHMSGPMMHTMPMHAEMRSMMGAPEKQFLSSLKQLLLVLAGFMLLTGAAVSYCLARSITAPIRQLDSAVKQVAGGDLSATVPVTTGDEIGNLASGFNSMTAKLRSNDTLRRRFLAGVAHELRTPLTILKANLEGVRDGVIESTTDQVASMTEEIDRMTKLVGDLRDLTLLEAGQLKLDKAAIDLNETVGNVVLRVNPLAAGQGVAIEADLAGGLPLVQGDVVRMTQVLDNLLLNAVKYTEPGGQVRVKSGRSGALVTIEIIDNGAGIAAEDLPHIFEHFYRADPSRAKASGGSGLGLAIVRQIVDAHGGNIEVESRPGHGSRFIVSLPIE